MSNSLASYAVYFIRRGVLWFSLPLIFLALYVFRFSAPQGAVFPHLSFVFSTLFFLGTLRYLVYSCLGERIGQILGALSSASVFSVMLLFYLLTYVGLETLGRVMSWSLISTYFAQGPELLNALGISLVLVVVGASSVFLGLVWFFWRLYKNHDPILMLAERRKTVFTTFLSTVLATVPPLHCYYILDGDSRVSGEPVSLMLYPNQGQVRVQSHYIARSVHPGERGGDVDAKKLRESLPNLVLIVVDALRADHLAFNGYHRSTAPYLESLFAAGRLVSIPEVYSVCSESSCGLMALAGSRYVHQFGKAQVTLHSLLRAYGYRVNLILGGDHTNFFGLREAYGPVDEYHDGSMAGGRYYMNDDQLVIDKVAAMPASNGQPTFFQFHLMSTHGLGNRIPETSRFLPSRNYYQDIAIRIPGRLAANLPGYINYYDNGIVKTDAVIQSLLQELEKKKYLENALVVITGDHGELLGEHGLMSHAKAPFEAVLKIPLIFARFGGRHWQPDWAANKEIVSQVDIAPTILRELDIDIPPGWSGIALQESRPRDYLFFQQGRFYGLIDLRGERERWKYWVEGIDGKDRAYDLLSDPGEISDRVGEIGPEQKRVWKRALLESNATAVEYIESFR